MKLQILIKIHLSYEHIRWCRCERQIFSAVFGKTAGNLFDFFLLFSRKTAECFFWRSHLHTRMHKSGDVQTCPCIVLSDALSLCVFDLSYWHFLNSR